MGWQGWCSGLVLCLYARMLGFESGSMQFFFFFFFLSLKFSKFMPVLFIGTGAGAVDTALYQWLKQQICFTLTTFSCLTGALVNPSTSSGMRIAGNTAKKQASSLASYSFIFQSEKQLQI